MKKIEGGVCAPVGFRANGVHCGIRKNKTKRDLSLIVSDVRAAAACVYTQNLVKGAPIRVTKRHVADGYAQAIVCNSGNANTCNADGEEIAEGMCALVEGQTGIPAADVVVASTGVIGQPLSLEPIRAGMPSLAEGLSEDGSLFAAQGIMTTDTVDKQIAYSFTLGGKECRIGAIGKGVGMINPNMATMLIFITTDASISPEMLQKALSADVKDSFNMVSVDGDTSTNDMVCVLANGMAENETVTASGKDFTVFRKALNKVTTALCRSIAKDGEGATKLLECKVTGAKSRQAARTVAKSILQRTALVVVVHQRISADVAAFRCDRRTDLFVSFDKFVIWNSFQFFDFLYFQTEFLKHGGHNLAAVSGTVWHQALAPDSTHDQRFVEQSIRIRNLHQVRHFHTAAALAEDHDVFRISSRYSDIFLYPLKSSYKVRISRIAGIPVFFSEWRKIQIAKDIQAVVDGDDNRVALHTHVETIVSHLLDGGT